MTCPGRTTHSNAGGRRSSRPPRPTTSASSCERTAEQVAECRYHHASTDWVAAAGVAVELVQSGRTGRYDPYTAAETHHEATACAIVTFFADPIFVSGTEIGNGQHRICAMKLAGVARCPIEV
jgi:hypothetical protein